MDEIFYAVSHIVDVLKDIAKQTRYTYLQADNTIRIDNQTGESWRLIWEWDRITGDNLPKWERFTIREDEPTTTDAPAPADEPQPNTYHCCQCNITFQTDTDDYPEKCIACGSSSWDLPF